MSDEIFQRVDELRDKSGMDWSEIAQEVESRTGIKISVITAMRSYEHAHRRIIRKSAGIGTEFKPRIDEEKFEQFQRLLEQGITNGAELARQIGVSRSTANRWKCKVSANPMS